MKPPELNQWQSIALGVVTGAAIMAAAFIVSLPDRNVPLTLLPTGTPAPLVVYITGAVKSPGVFHIPPGSRIQDIVEASGGYLDGADIQRINLAAPVLDGQRIDIPYIAASAAQDTGTATKSDTPNGGDVPNISLNNASRKELESLPGIGVEKASSILAERERRGRFLSIDELLEIDGFSQKLVDQIRPYLYID